ncbi:MAG: hypothetical protein JWP89_5962 [Schlesneria sp.]|nr:hypothetical protein [Schlesneria sp.]
MAGPLIPRVSLIEFMPPTECAEFILKSALPEMSGPSGLWKFDHGPIPGPKGPGWTKFRPLGPEGKKRADNHSDYSGLKCVDAYAPSP